MYSVIQLLEMKRAYINGPAVHQVHRRSRPAPLMLSVIAAWLIQAI
jgi:hypothetical protein